MMDAEELLKNRDYRLIETYEDNERIEKKYIIMDNPFSLIKHVIIKPIENDKCPYDIPPGTAPPLLRLPRFKK